MAKPQMNDCYDRGRNSISMSLKRNQISLVAGSGRGAWPTSSGVLSRQCIYKSCDLNVCIVDNNSEKGVNEPMTQDNRVY